MEVMHVALFGRLTVRVGDREPVRFHSIKEQELLAYLLLHRERPQARERVASLLWSETTTARSRAYLRKALWRLRAALVAGGLATPERLLHADTDWVRLDISEGVDLDVVSFERGLAEAAGCEPSDRRVTVLLEQAAALYGEGLLEGWYSEWCLIERETYHHRYLDVLERLTVAAEAEGRFDAALAYALLLLHHNEVSERAHRRLMWLRYRTGDRSGALRQYVLCARMLREELGVRPSARTEALHERIRRGGEPRGPHAPVAQPDRALAVRREGEAAGGALRLLLRRLEDMVEEVRREVEWLEREHAALVNEH